MNTTAPPRDAWSLLVFKARQSLETCQQALVQARARQQQLEASEVRLRQLMAEYRQRQLTTLAGGQLMADSLNERQFIAQLQRLLDQAVRATSAAVQLSDTRAAAVVHAQRELDKSEKLLAHARTIERARQERSAQQMDDEWAMIRFRRLDA